jgi:uncharacterized protein
LLLYGDEAQGSQSHNQKTWYRFDAGSQMMEPFTLLVLATSCAFMMGYSVNQGSTCAVAAARELVDQRQGKMLTGFAIAIGTAGVICLPLAWISGGTVHLAGDVGISGSLILGAVLLGIGALINDACLFGALSRIGRGEVRFFALPVGLTLGFAIADRQDLFRAAPSVANTFAEPTSAGYLVVAGYAILLVVNWLRLGREAVPPTSRDWPLRRSMVTLGICGALLFILTPGWTYADAVHRAVAPGDGTKMIAAGVIIAALAALGGALASGIRARSFHFEKPTVRTLLRSLIGGTIMAFGGTLIPGGNDTLLLSSVPSATVSGLTAYAVMSITVPLLMILFRRYRSRSAH